MSKEYLEAIKIKIEEAYKQLWHEREYAYDSKVCSKGKGWAEAIQHYDNIGRNLLEVKRILDDLLTEYEAIDNANPNEALECLNILQNVLDKYLKTPLTEYIKLFDCINNIKQYILKAEEPKQYLKWEDLEFTEESKEMIVRMGDNVYKMTYRNRDGGWITLEDCQRIYLDLLENEKKFFNDLHLEEVKE